MKEIKLTQGQVAIVDNEDFEYLNRFRWYAAYYKNKYYATRGIWFEGKQKMLRMHWLLLDRPEALVVDHINGNSLDNRKENLRVCTQQQNCMNRLKRIKKTSAYKGVSFHDRNNTWEAKIMINGKSLYLGRYKTEIQAAAIYDKAALEYFGEFAKLNRIGG